MVNKQLSYRDLEYLTQDTLHDSLIAEACEGFLQQDTTEDGKLYAKSKLKKIQSLLSGIPDLGSLQVCKDLIDLADNRNDIALKAFSRAKAIFTAADLMSLSRESDTSKEDLFRLTSDVIGRVVQNESEFRRIKLEQCCEALGIALGSPALDVPSAIEATKYTQIPEKDLVLIPFVVAAVGIANEISHTDLDEGYQILSNISVQTPDTMYPRFHAILNRLARYVNENERSAIQQAKQAVKDVRDFCDGTASSADDSEYSRFVSDVLGRKKDALRVAMGKMAKLIESLESEVDSTSRIKTEMIKTGIADMLNHAPKNARGCALFRVVTAIEQNFVL